MKSIKTICEKSDAGFLEDILPVFVGIFVMIFIFSMVLSGMDSIQKKNKIDLAARRGILSMETCGYLDAATRDEMVEDLRETGAQSIQISTHGYNRETGTWYGVTEEEPAAYGEKIELEIEGTLPVSIPILAGNGLFSSAFEAKTQPFSVTRVSTGKN